MVDDPVIARAPEVDPHEPPPAGAVRILRVPLAIKLVGANLLVALVAWSTTYFHERGNPGSGHMEVVLALALVTGLAVNLLLVFLALHPVRELERTVQRLWHGDADARVLRSPVGDPRLDQVGGTLNALLDNLNQDRERLHGLASEVIRAQDGERARIGRELHESIAQSLAALTYQLTAAENDSRDPTMAARLRAIRIMGTQVLDEVDMLSHTVHPRVLNDLGLVPGLRHLARTVADAKHAIEVSVSEGREADFRGLGIETASVLYRVAQEAIQNAMRHAQARRIEISVGAGDDAVSLQVDDDGIGFSVEEASKRRPGMGLFTMRERVGLVRGEFTVRSILGKGTSVRVRIPVARDTFKPVEALVQ